MAVAFCAGSRCSAVRRLADERRSARPSTLSLLARAVRSRRHSVLIQTGCPGLCSHSAVVSVGWAAVPSDASSLSFDSPPITLEQTETAGRAEAVAAWVRNGAPDVRRLLALLGRTPA